MLKWTCVMMTTNDNIWLFETADNIFRVDFAPRSESSLACFRILIFNELCPCARQLWRLGLSRLHTSNFSLTSVIDNVDMLICTNDMFSLTSFAFASLICWCERINKFSLTSFHCSQQYNYTADDIKTNHRAPFSFFGHGSCKNKTAVRLQFSLSTCTNEQVLQCVNFPWQVHLSRKNLTSSSVHTSK